MVRGKGSGRGLARAKGRGPSSPAETRTSLLCSRLGRGASWKGAWHKEPLLSSPRDAVTKCFDRGWSMGPLPFGP